MTVENGSYQSNVLVFCVAHYVIGIATAAYMHDRPTYSFYHGACALKEGT